MKRSDNKEFVKVGKIYLIKNSNGRIVSEKEKLELEKKELIIEDVKSECGKEASKKLKRVNKKIKEVENGNNSIKETIPIEE